MYSPGQRLSHALFKGVVSAICKYASASSIFFLVLAHRNEPHSLCGGFL